MFLTGFQYLCTSYTEFVCEKGRICTLPLKCLSESRNRGFETVLVTRFFTPLAETASTRNLDNDSQHKVFEPISVVISIINAQRTNSRDSLFTSHVYSLSRPPRARCTPGLLRRYPLLHSDTFDNVVPIPIWVDHKTTPLKHRLYGAVRCQGGVNICGGIYDFH
jgi:hypothetical protein